MHLPDIKCKMTGQYRIQRVEKEILHRKRLEFARRHVDFDGFRQRNGFAFSGSEETFLMLSRVDRNLINADLRRHIEEHEAEWAVSPVARVVEERGLENNLVLNQGFDYLLGDYNFLTGRAFEQFVVGTGTAPVLATNTGLSSEVKRSSTYVSGGNGNSFTSPVWTSFRTCDFSVETVERNYTELGWSYYASAGNNLYARALISSGTVTILVGQQLRVRYNQNRSILPNSTQTFSGDLVTGVPGSSGTWSISPFQPMYVTSDTGLSQNGSDIFDYNHGFSMRAVTGTMSHSFWNTPTGYTTISPTASKMWDAYVTGSFQRTCRFATWSAGSFSGSVSGFVLQEGSLVGLAIKLNTPFTKDTLHTLRPPSYTISYST